MVLALSRDDPDGARRRGRQPAGVDRGHRRAAVLLDGVRLSLVAADLPARGDGPARPACRPARRPQDGRVDGAQLHPGPARRSWSRVWRSAWSRPTAARRGSRAFSPSSCSPRSSRASVYGGKTWCNFVCPVGLVEKIYTEPSRSATGRPAELTSQCAPCVACKRHCPDIDLEQGYWKEATERTAARSRTSRGPASSSASTPTTSWSPATGRTTSPVAGPTSAPCPTGCSSRDSRSRLEIPRVVAAPLTLLVIRRGELRGVRQRSSG